MYCMCLEMNFGPCCCHTFMQSCWQPTPRFDFHKQNRIRRRTNTLNDRQKTCETHKIVKRRNSKMGKTLHITLTFTTSYTSYPNTAQYWLMSILSTIFSIQMILMHNMQFAAVLSFLFFFFPLSSFMFHLLYARYVILHLFVYASVCCSCIY